jgi:uncharacterized membrane protein YgcG
VAKPPRLYGGAVLSRSRRLTVLAFVSVLALALAGPAVAEQPWEPDPYDSEGVYIIVGTGPPNARIDLVRDGSAFHTPYGGDSTLTEGEYTSPTGEFRIDEGFCNPGADCHGGDASPFRLVFHRLDQKRVPIWAPGSYFRNPGAGSKAFNLPEVDDVPRTSRVTLSTSGPASLPAYATISGTTWSSSASGVATPLKGVTVDAYNAAGLGRSDLSYAGAEAGYGVSNADGKWSMSVPPGQWALKYRTSPDEPFYPGYIWSGCVIEPSYIPPPAGTPPPAGVAYVDTAGVTTGIDLTVGAGGRCNSIGSLPPPPPSDGGDGGGGGGAGGGGPAGGGGAAGGGGSAGGGGPANGGGPAGGAPTITAAAKVTAGPGGAVTVSVTVPGPGKLSANAVAKLAKASAKKTTKSTTIATGSATATKAGTIKLIIKPTKAAKKLLAKGRTLKATAMITFKPTTGAATTVSKSLRFKTKPAKR